MEHFCKKKVREIDPLSGLLLGLSLFAYVYTAPAAAK